MIEPRQGIGCLVYQAGSWRYRSFRPSELGEIGGWIPGCDVKAQTFSTVMRTQANALPAIFEGVPDEQARFFENHVVKNFAVADSWNTSVAETLETVRRRSEVRHQFEGRWYRGLSRWLGSPDSLSAPAAGATELVRTARERALAAARARSWGRRCSTVVFEKSAGAGLLHELLGHALEGDNAALQSPYTLQLLQGGVVPSILTVRDDPSIANGYGSYRFDDEGQSGKGHYIVTAGECSPISSVRSSWTAGTFSTGNGRRQDYRYPSIPRASNTVVEAGGDADDSILTPDRPGTLVVGGLGAGEINMATGEFVFSALDSYFLTSDGVREAVRDASLVGNAIQVLQRLEAVGREATMENITCGKQGQYVGVGLSSPRMRFSKLDWTAA
ncbi:metallopeptidase TldD-related protein [Streptomyces sp. CNS654]|uniref:metallopeptidase TldD-related protein n=1 Tax=Streptomyces sp. CNS654 TaxID=1506995 RepID=UPI00099852B3|nr:metallopeptidase TldD-related protein [Streptomyces sp. CNS654]